MYKGVRYMKELKIGNLTAKLPIIQGGMGIGISMSRLAKAVASEGGIGTISGVQAGFKEPDFNKNPVLANTRVIKREILKAKENAKNIIAINLMAPMKNYEIYVKEAIKNKVDIIISGAGLPLKLPSLIKNSATKIIPIVSSAKAIKLIIKSWLKQDKLPDAVVLEGPLAGGHLGFKYDDLINDTCKSLDELIVEVKEEIQKHEVQHSTKIPLIVAGGIHTSRDIERVLSLGADGVQIGTRFIGTEECDADINFKKKFIESKADDLRIIKSPVGLPARAIYNDFLEKAYTDGFKITSCDSCMPYCKPKEIPFCISKHLTNVASGGDGLVFSGAYGYKINEIVPVKTLLDELFPDRKS